MRAKMNFHPLLIHCPIIPLPGGDRSRRVDNFRKNRDGRKRGAIAGAGLMFYWALCACELATKVSTDDTRKDDDLVCIVGT